MGGLHVFFIVFYMLPGARTTAQVSMKALDSDPLARGRYMGLHLFLFIKGMQHNKGPSALVPTGYRWVKQRKRGPLSSNATHSNSGSGGFRRVEGGSALCTRLIPARVCL